MKKIFYLLLLLSFSSFSQGAQLIEVSRSQFANEGGSGTELLTESNAAAKENEGNSLGSFDPSWYGAVETTEVHAGTYSYFLGNGGTYIFVDLDLTGVIGDEIVFNFWVKCATQEAQQVTLSGTDNNADFLGGTGNQPTTWTNFSRTVTLTSTGFYIRLTKNGAGGEAGGLYIDDLSIINNGQ